MTAVTIMAPMPKDGRYSMPFTVLGTFLNGTMKLPLAKPTYVAQRRPVVVRLLRKAYLFPWPARFGMTGAPSVSPEVASSDNWHGYRKIRAGFRRRFCDGCPGRVAAGMGRG